MSVAIITGGSGALGTSVARTLAKQGHEIVLADSPRSKDRANALAKELGGVACGVDLATTQGWEEVIRVAGEPSLAALVAGGWKGGTPIHEEKDDETFDAMISSNLLTVQRALRALLPGMVARKNGSIVVVGSRNVERPWTGANASAYTAAKSAAVALANTAASEVLHHGVRINSVLVSTMDTPANRTSMPKADFSRWVTTDSVASVISFLLSDDARDISGAEIPIYGRA